jgi:hypothetical protein
MKAMRNALRIAMFILISTSARSQTNTFPSSGNAGAGTISPAYKFVVSNSGSQGVEIDPVSPTITGGIDLNFYNRSTQSRSPATFIGSLFNFSVGNVGIGTSSPVSKFVVSNAGAGGLEFDPTGSSLGGFSMNSYNRSSFSRMDIELTAKEMQFFSGTSSLSLSLKIDSTGKIGIGTTSPSEKLSVEGNAYIHGNISSNGYITTKKITVKQLNWSDYVFAKDYKLRSLSSLESYIKQNKHLPEVPTANEVEEQGISVGDNQALLLKKIEELTLYVIELKKENIEQQKQINTLKKSK